MLKEETIEFEQTKPMWQIEKEAINKALQEANGKVDIAAKALEIGRATMYRKVKKYGLKVND